MKILILHASAGAGHRRAAEALGKGFAAACPEAQVEIRDILEFTPAVFRKTYGERYLEVIKKVPELWGYVYARSDKKALEPLRRRLRSFVNKTNTLEFAAFVRAFEPDVVVCTHFMPLEILSRRIRKGKSGASLFCAVTDFAVHALWVVEHVSCYYVAAEEARRQLLRHGQPEDGVRVTGIPIDPVFARSLPRAEARRRLGIDDSLPVVLVLSGGAGVGPMAELVRAVGASGAACRLLVVAGANAELKAGAEEAARGLSVPVTVFGFVTTLHELMDAADLIVSKPGGLTTAEALAKGKPMLIVDPIPGQEQRNCEHLLEAGAAARLFDIADAGYKIGELLADPERLARMGRQAAEIGHPDAAVAIARDIVERHQARRPAPRLPAGLRDGADD
jgi:processive 1,2-diacylglycerol beta-glucosyltransferase